MYVRAGFEYGEGVFGIRVLGFLELSGVDRVVENEADKEERRTVRLHGWIAWEAEEPEGSRRISNLVDIRYTLRGAV